MLELLIRTYYFNFAGASFNNTGVNATTTFVGDTTIAAMTTPAQHKTSVSYEI